MSSSATTARDPSSGSRPYRRRRPERGALHATVLGHLETFLAARRSPDGDGVPRFVE